jgi:putative ABC transport system permease protein
MGVPLLAGRLFDARDMETGRRVIVVNEPFARRYWDDPRAAIGRRVQRAGVWFDVVGVAGATAGDGRGTEPAPLVYAPSGAEPRGMPYAYYAVRTAGSPLALVDALRRVVVDVDDTLPLADVMTMEGRVAAASARERLALEGIGISVAASIAVVVASRAGLRGLALLQRRRACGIRNAVGATDLRLRLLVARGGLLPAAAGVAAGALLVLAGLRAPASLLQGEAEVAVSLGVAGALLAAVVLAATVMASRGIARIEASQALRAD